MVRSWLKSLFGNRRSHTARPQAKSVRLAMEVLENRELPASLLPVPELLQSKNVAPPTTVHSSMGNVQPISVVQPMAVHVVTLGPKAPAPVHQSTPALPAKPVTMTAPVTVPKVQISKAGTTPAKSVQTTMPALILVTQTSTSRMPHIMPAIPLDESGPVRQSIALPSTPAVKAPPMTPSEITAYERSHPVVVPMPPAPNLTRNQLKPSADTEDSPITVAGTPMRSDGGSSAPSHGLYG